MLRARASPRTCAGSRGRVPFRAYGSVAAIPPERSLRPTGHRGDADGGPDPWARRGRERSRGPRAVARFSRRRALRSPERAEAIRGLPGDGVRLDVVRRLAAAAGVGGRIARDAPRVSGRDHGALLD